jgi:hypothetical protein
MKVFGVSQSSGAERVLYVEGGSGGIVLAIREQVKGRWKQEEQERASVAVREDDLLPAITDPVPGGATVEGTSPAHGWKMLLKVEVRRNEVWLSARPVTGLVVEDIAVGMDDFQDALDEAIGGTAGAS